MEMDISAVYKQLPWLLTWDAVSRSSSCMAVMSRVFNPPVIASGGKSKFGGGSSCYVVVVCPFLSFSNCF